MHKGQVFEDIKAGENVKTNTKSMSESTKKPKKAQAHLSIYLIKTQLILQSIKAGVAVHSLIAYETTCSGWELVKYLTS